MFSFFVLYDHQMGPVFIFFIVPLCVEEVKKPNGDKFSFFWNNLSLFVFLCLISYAVCIQRICHRVIGSEGNHLLPPSNKTI